MEVIVQSSCQLKRESVVVAECFILSFRSGHPQVHGSDLKSSSDNKHVSTQKTHHGKKATKEVISELPVLESLTLERALSP